MEEIKTNEEPSQNVTRRNFIKGVIAAGAAVSSASYLFRTSALGQQPAAPGSVERLVTLMVNGQERRVDVLKQETLAQTGASRCLAGGWRTVAGRRDVPCSAIGKEPVATEHTAVGCIVLHPALLSHSRRDTTRSRGVQHHLCQTGRRL